MNEQEAYKTAVKHQIVDDDQIKRSAKTAAPQRKTALRVLKPIGIAIAALLVVFGVTMAIPKARAEVMRWLRPTDTQEYFTQDPEDREPNAELDSMIVPAEQSNTRVVVHSIAGDEIFAEIAKALETVELGDTMYDGETLYIRMRMNGIAALPSVEWLTSGNLTKTVIPPALTPGYFEDNRTPEEFLSGEIPYWMEAETNTTFTFADGTMIEGGWAEVDDADIRPLVDSLRKDGLDHGTYSTPEQMAVVNERELAYLEGRTVDMISLAYMAGDVFLPDGSRCTMAEEFRKHADENGRVTVTVGLRVAQDLGEGPAFIVLDATLGEVTVDLNAYQSLKKTALHAHGTEAVFAPEQTYFTWYEWGVDENGVPLPYVIYQNEAIDLDGLRLKGLDGGYIDARGIQNLRIAVTPPKGWNRQMLEQLDFMFMGFKVLINGQPVGYTNREFCEVRENGTVRVTIGWISGVPLASLDDVETVTLIPVLSYLSVRRVYDETGETLTDIPLEPGVPFVNDRDTRGSLLDETTEYPQYAITFTVD
jgi:hypothetical protein